jgi:hypothetical protein
MTSLLRVIRLFALVTWVGSLFFFAFAVARVAFSVLPDAHAAGSVVRGSLIALHHVGLTAGIIYLAATLTLIATQRDSHFARAFEALIVLIMLALTAYSHFSIIPRMDADRATLGDNVATAPDNATHRHFDRLHGLSVKLEAGVLFCGVLLICFAPLPSRSPQDSLYF